MLFGKGGDGTKGGSIFSKDKPNLAIIAVLVVVVLGAGFFVYRTMTGSGQPEPEAAGAYVGPPMDPNAIQPGGAPMPGPGPAAPGQPATPPAPGNPPASAPPPAAPATGEPAAPPSPAPPAQQTAQPPAPARPAASAPTAKADQNAMSTMKVFGAVTISYPSSWKIRAGAGNTSAVFTNGKASYEVHPPDLKAADARAIAMAGVKKLAPGSAITGQGAARCSNQNCYWVTVGYRGGTARIVGIDGPARIVLFQHVAGGQFSAYKSTFDQMQDKIRF